MNIQNASSEYKTLSNDLIILDEKMLRSFSNKLYLERLEIQHKMVMIKNSLNKQHTIN